MIYLDSTYIVTEIYSNDRHLLAAAPHFGHTPSPRQKTPPLQLFRSSPRPCPER